MSWRTGALFGSRSSLVICEALGGNWGYPWGDKDEEIRVRMGKFTKQPWRGRGAASGVSFIGYVGNKGLNLAPREEPLSVMDLEKQVSSLF